MKALCLATLLAVVIAYAPPAMAEEPTPEVNAGFASSTMEFVGRYGSYAEELVAQGMSFLGIPYRYGGTTREGLDCSGLVQQVFSSALGLDLPRTAREMASLGSRVNRSELKPGDLVFFNTMRRAFSHVGIYIGDNQFLHAPSKGGEVRVESLSGPYWTKRFNGARRVLPEQGLDATLSSPN